MSTLRANTLKPITSGNSLVLQGDSGGSGVSGPSIDSNGDVDFTQNTNAKVKLPSGGGIFESNGSTEILTESSGTVTLSNVTFGSGNTGFGIQTTTAQNTTSGTAFEFTGLPSTVEKITVILSEVSLSGTNSLLIQIGDSGGFETSGYESTSMDQENAATPTCNTSTSGYIITINVANRQLTGNFEINHIGSNKWVCSGSGKINSPSTTSSTTITGGFKTLSGVLDRVRITPAGSNTFDNGTVRISFF